MVLFLLKFTERLKPRWFRKGRFPCPYYERTQKKTKGVAGFCRLQNREIYFDWKVGCIPYHFCEGLDNYSKATCGVYIHFGNDTMEKMGCQE